MRQTLSGLLLVILAGIITGCASENTAQAEEAEPVELTGLWQVEDIDESGVIDRTMVTLQLEGDNKITGSTGCNRYTGDVNTNDSNFVVANVVSTRRACVPAVSSQEQRFLTALNEASHYEIKSSTWLVVFDASDKQRLKLIKASPQQTLPAEKSD